MSARDWEERVLAAEGAAERVGEVEQELLLASKPTARRPRPAASKPPGCVFRTRSSVADRRALPAHYDRFYRSARLP